METKKYARESLTIMTEMVLPNDTNTLNNLMGGRLLYMMDVVAAVAAQKHSNCLVVTASVDNVSFAEPIPLGSIVTLEAKVTRVFNTSMEVHINVYADDYPNKLRFSTNRAFYTFVTLDNKSKKPCKAPEVEPETDAEKELYEGALRRRQLRLVLAGKMKAIEANELRSIFENI
jgi:acyl-CoA hydrolase